MIVIIIKWLKSWLLGNTRQDIYKLLDTADEEYMLAYERKDSRVFEQYCTVGFKRKMQSRVVKGTTIYFGLPKYRRRTWEFVDKSNTITVYKKTLTHEHVMVTKTMRLPLGDDISELWYLVEDRNQNIKINDIRRIRC